MIVGNRARHHAAAVVATSFALLALATLVSAQWQPIVGTVYSDAKAKHGLRYSSTYEPNAAGALAWGYVTNELGVMGWNRMYVETAEGVDDDTQAYAAGYLEGYMSNDLIFLFFQDEILYYILHPTSDVVLAEEIRSAPPTERMAMIRAVPGYGDFLKFLVDYVEGNEKYIADSIKANPTDPYWHQVSLVMSQQSGVIDGYHAAAPIDHPMVDIEIKILMSSEDMLDVLTAAEVNKQFTGRLRLMEHYGATHDDLFKRRYLDMKPEDAFVAAHRDGLSCSGLVKPVGDDIFTSHVTWSDFHSMLRIYKTYVFNFGAASETESQTISFSGYPALLVSMDDYYTTSAGLTVLETTNSIFNMSLYAYVQPQTLLCWMRTAVANRMAATPRDWTEIFAKENSGTYNNQWIVVATAAFKPGTKTLPAESVMIVEQIPGYCEAEDVTPFVNEHGYWASYNIPSIPRIFNESGYPEMVLQQGEIWTWDHCPRANIFRALAPNVTTMTGMENIMRWNDPESSLSHGNPTWAISSRFDLLSKNAQSFGGIDAKISSLGTFGDTSNMTSRAISGPSHEFLPPFDWTVWPTPGEHWGQPEMWNFTYVTMTIPATPPAEAIDARGRRHRHQA